MSIEATLYKSNRPNLAFTPEELELGYAVGFHTVKGESVYLWRTGGKILLDWAEKKFGGKMYLSAIIMTDELWDILLLSDEFDEIQLEAIQDFKSELLPDEVAWIQIH